MNLNSKGARRTLAATCSTAIVAVAGAAFFAAPASAQVHAKSALSITGGTNVTALDLGQTINSAFGGGVLAITAAHETLTNSTTVTDSDSPFTSADIGDTVTGSGVPAGTYIVAETGGTATLSQPITSITGIAYNQNRQANLLNPLLQPSYGLRVTSATTSRVWFKLLTAPSNSAGLWVDDVASTATPAGGSGSGDNLYEMTVGGTDGNSKTAAPQHLVGTGVATASDRLFLAPSTAGTYTVEFFEDVDNNGVLNSTDDNVSSVVTVNALHVGSTNPTWAPTVSAPTSTTSGQAIPLSVDLSGLTLTDARGSTAIGGALANLIGGTFAGTGLASTGASLTYAAAHKAAVSGFSGTTATVTSSALTAASPPVSATSTAYFDIGGGGITAGSPAYLSDLTNTANEVSLGAPTTSVQAAGSAVSSLTVENVTGSVSQSGTADTTNPGYAGTSDGQTIIKGGVGSVTYDAKAGNAAGSTVRFTLTPYAGTSSSSVTCSSSTPDLTANGSLVSSTGTGGTKIYTVGTNGSGVASLTVTSNDTTGGCPIYTVQADSDGVSAHTYYTRAQYVIPTPKTIAITNSSSDLLPAVGTASVTLTASLEDQFGTIVAPLSSDSQEAGLVIGSSTLQVPVNGKSFSYTYSPASAPAAATSQAFTWSYSGTTAGTLPSVIGHVVWVSNTPAGSVTLATPLNGAVKVNLSSSGTIAPLQSSTGDTFGDVNSQVTGTVMDGSSKVLPYKSVKLSGSDGVYFSDKKDGTDPFTTTMRVVTNGSGQFNGAYVFFTKSGTPTVTATVDSQSATATVTTNSAADPYLVEVDDASGLPNTAITISGHLEDLFGNAVPSQCVELAVTPSGSGTLSTSTVQDSANIPCARTQSDGTYSATFTPSAGVKDSFTITATADTASGTWTTSGGVTTYSGSPQTANEVADSGWANNAGLTKLQAGQYQDTSDLTVGPIVLSAPKTHVGQGFVQLKGKASPNSQITIKGRTQGSTSGLVELDTVTTDSKGNFEVLEWITDTTTFVAVSGTQYSPSITVVKTAGGGSSKKDSVRINTKGVGKGKVLVQANGYPDKKGTLTFYVNGKKVRTATSNAKGDLNVVISTGKGKKTIKITFATSGYTTNSVSKTITVK